MAGKLSGITMTVETVIPSDSSIVNSHVSPNAQIARSKLEQNTFADYVVNWAALRVWDAFQTNLPGTAASDDLAVITGTWGTNAVTVRTSDAKQTTVTQRAVFLFTLPPEFDAAESVRIRVRAGMVTTVSDGTATVDIEAHEWDGDGAVGADLCTTVAQSINSLTKADKDFTITSTDLAAGDVIAVRVTIAITDAATGTVVLGEISKVSVQLDIRG
jgi:hypothetical protein